MYLLAINQALPYGCSFVTYGHPEGSAAGDITIIWNDVFKQSVDCAHPILSLFIFFCHHHHMECLHFSDLRIFSLSFPLCEWFSSTHSFCLFTMFTMLINIYIYIRLSCKQQVVGSNPTQTQCNFSSEGLHWVSHGVVGRKCQYFT